MPAQSLAILNCHLSFRYGFGHNLQLAAATLGSGIADPDKPETEVGYRAFDNLADPRFYQLCVRRLCLARRQFRALTEITQ